MRPHQKSLLQGFIEPASLLTFGVLVTLIVATTLGISVFTTQDRPTEYRSEAYDTCEEVSVANCTSVPGCSVQSRSEPCTLANCSTYPNHCTYVAAQTDSCTQFISQSACTPSGCSWDPIYANCTTSTCNQSGCSCTTTYTSCMSLGCPTRSECTTTNFGTCNLSNCSRYPSYCTYRAGYCTGPAGCTGSSQSACTGYCTWVGPSCTGRYPSECTGQVVTGTSVSGRYITNYRCNGTFTSAAAYCRGTYPVSYCGGTPHTPTPVRSPTPLRTPTPSLRANGQPCTQDSQCLSGYCGRDADNTFACATRPSPTPTRTPAPIRTPTPRPASPTPACNGVCFPIGEPCAQTGSGGCPAYRFCCAPTPTQRLPSPTPVPCNGTCFPIGEPCAQVGTGSCPAYRFCCAPTPTQRPASPTPGTTCYSPGSACSSRALNTCSVNGVPGTQTCTFTRCTTTSPFSCTLSPTNCTTCNVVPTITRTPTPLRTPTPRSPTPTPISTQTLRSNGQLCSQDNQCLSGYCARDADNFSACATRPSPTPGSTCSYPSAPCSRRSLQTCIVNGVAGTQTCTFTRCNNISPFECSQNPTNCTTCSVVPTITPAPYCRSQLQLSCAAGCTPTSSGGVCTTPTPTPYCLPQLFLSCANGCTPTSTGGECAATPAQAMECVHGVRRCCSDSTGRSGTQSCNQGRWTGCLSCATGYSCSHQTNACSPPAFDTTATVSVTTPNRYSVATTTVGGSPQTSCVVNPSGSFTTLSDCQASISQLALSTTYIPGQTTSCATLTGPDRTACFAAIEAEHQQDYETTRNTALALSVAVPLSYYAIPAAGSALATTWSTATLGGTVGTAQAIANLSTASYITATSALSTLPTWITTTAAVTGMAADTTSLVYYQHQCSLGDAQACSLAGDIAIGNMAAFTTYAWLNAPTTAQKGSLIDNFNNPLSDIDTFYHTSVNADAITPISPGIEARFLAEDEIFQYQDYWEFWAMSKKSPSYKQLAASSIYQGDLNTSLLNLPDPYNILNTLEQQQYSSAQELLQQTTSLIQQRNQIPVYYTMPNYSNSPQPLTINNVDASNVGGVFRQSGSYTLYDPYNPTYKYMGTTNEIYENFYNRNPYIYIDDANPNIAEKVTILLHEYGHAVEAQSLFTKYLYDGEIHRLVPSTEVISTLYGIRSAEILAPIIGPEAAAELMAQQIVLNRWIVTGQVLP